jgi:hypothetical protein
VFWFPSCFGFPVVWVPKFFWLRTSSVALDISAGPEGMYSILPCTCSVVRDCRKLFRELIFSTLPNSVPQPHVISWDLPVVLPSPNCSEFPSWFGFPGCLGFLQTTPDVEDEESALNILPVAIVLKKSERSIPNPEFRSGVVESQCGVGGRCQVGVEGENSQNSILPSTKSRD